METPEEKFVESLLSEYSLPNDAKPGENPTTYRKRKEHEEREQILKNINQLKNQ